jgi:hypothetical protein
MELKATTARFPPLPVYHGRKNSVAASYPDSVPEPKKEIPSLQITALLAAEKSKQKEDPVRWDKKSRWDKSYHCGRAKYLGTLHVEDCARLGKSE